MIRVLFVCLGNICRSPMAEGVFMDLVRKADLDDQIEADSAGTGYWHMGEPPHSGTRRILKEHGINYNGRARLIRQQDLNEFDYIVAMDASNYEVVRELGQGKAQLHTLMEFAPQLGIREVPDPYYDGRFDLVYDLVRQGAQGLLETVRRDHGL